MKLTFPYKILSWWTDYPTQAATAQGVGTLPPVPMNQLLTNILILTIVACDNQVDNKIVEQGKDTSSISSSEKVDSVNLNFRDDKGLKQGQWSSINKQKEVEIFTYRNDTLNGYYSIGNSPWRHEGNYKDGKLDGIDRTYAGNRVEHMRFFKNGEAIWWVSYAADGKNLIPLKGFQIADDTALHIVAPFHSGQTWYEGDFISTKHFKSKYLSHFQTFMTGIHKTYFENGKLRGQVNYNNKTITEYDSLGQKIYSTKLSDYEIHKQTFPALYLE
ncbi:MAG: hypothetical protein WC760_10750 [Bacteroidia bacterium]|jgi:antitoxin component YwqK of YwqJK toxin-antitoxin module